MQGSTNGHSSPESVTIHPLDPGDAAITAVIRTMASSTKGLSQGVEARAQFDAFMESVVPPDGVTAEPGTVGGVAGLWVRPSRARPDRAILHLHGGWFNFGSANAYRHLVGHLAARAGASAFIPDYRLAPEHPFPSAVDDALACFEGLAESGIQGIAVTGDSAGGNLALGLASRVTETTVLGVAVFSPVTDLTLASPSYETRAEADPFFTRGQVAELVHSYLGDADPEQPLASPVYGRLTGMPPVRIYVGDDEVLLDDSLRFVERAVVAGVDARSDVWMGMPHGFVASVGKLKAAGQAFDAAGAFIAERL